MQGMDYVYAVWQEKSFSAAARKLFVSQPALSASVRKVERELGLPIFDRSTTPLQLTDAGRAYIEAAERIFRIKRDLKSYCDDLAGLESGTLRLGGTNFFASCFLPPMIEAFSRRHPHIALSVTESDSADLFDKLTTEELDIIVDSGVCDDSLYETVPFYQDHILLSVPAAFPINERFPDYRLTRQDILMGRHLGPSVPAVPLAAFVALLFIPAMNLSGMISSRMDHRLCELGVRRAYGATNKILLGQVLWENLLLTCLGGLIGILLSYLIVLTASDWILNLFDDWVNDPDKTPFLSFEMLFNPWIFSFAFVLCVLLNLISAFVPALWSLRHTIIQSLNTKR